MKLSTIRRTVIVCCVFLLASNTLTQEEWGTVEELIGYDGQIIDYPVYTFTNDTQAEEAIDNILSISGISANFILKSANVPNALAQVRDGGRERYILYNRQWLQELADKTNDDWAGISILAHEMGHHVNFHVFEGTGSRPILELEADRYSGFILAQMGATLDEAQSAVKMLITNEHGTDTHPPRSARLSAIADGWYEGCEKARNCTDASFGISATTAPTHNQDWEVTMENFDNTNMLLVPMNDDLSFWIDVTEVTRESFGEYCSRQPNCTNQSNDTSYLPSHPINNITWFEASSYCASRQARLPTETEWEYAARGPDEFTYPWGNQFNPEFVHAGERSMGITAPVGSYPMGASWVGAQDMVGNLWEWTSSSPGTFVEKRVIRGGSWLNTQAFLITSNRHSESPYFKNEDLGFRCAKDSF